MVRCGEASLIAQQISNNENETSLRAWNPKKIEAMNNDPDERVNCPIFCLTCFVVELFYKKAVKEVIEVIKPEISGAHELFDAEENDAKSTTKIMRWVSWFLNVLGHYMLFAPIIKILAWIPLVGSLLAHIIAFAAVVIALLWGTCIHLTVLATSWIVYRPLYALLLFTLIGIGIGLLFIGGDQDATKAGQVGVSDVVNTSAVVGTASVKQ